uniref:PHD-type domain-containing protein n=1 Tax=Rhabditophanes sp. KR3021 TaxID=114890 RepID=A0AC35TNK5_9BILA
MSIGTYKDYISNCVLWNHRVQLQRQQNPPVINFQTGIVERPGKIIRNVAHRFHGTGHGQICSYASKRWHKSKHPSSDQIELKYFVSCNRGIGDVLTVPTPLVTPPVSEPIIAPIPVVSSSRSAPVKYEEPMDFEEMDYEKDMLSDEDEYANKKKKPGKGKGRGNHKKANKDAASSSVVRVESITSPEKPFICQVCGAKYKSRPGLSYHRLHVHPDTPNVIDPSIIDPVVNISTTCDYCSGTKKKNKKSGKAEILIGCHDCGRSVHPSCASFTENIIKSALKHGWHCISCKSCTICGISDSNSNSDDSQLLFCDGCDHAYHLYCLPIPLKSVPENDWSCDLCKKEYSK